MTKSAWFAVPGDLATPTGGYAYDRRVVAGLRELGWTVGILDLGAGFPSPGPQVHARASAELGALPRTQPIVVDGLALGVLPDVAEELKASHLLLALVHHPLALETGLAVEATRHFRTSERTALACTRHVIATSQATARLLTDDYAVSPEQVTVVEPGTDLPAVRTRTRSCSSPRSSVALLAVGAIVPRKGYDLLIAALAELCNLPWHLVIVGDRGRSPDTVAQLERDIARRDLGARVSLRGAVHADELTALYESSDLFVLPSRFEGYGMAYAEAIAHGVPVVATRAGAIPDTVPASAGVLVPPDDAAALAAALRRLISDARERARLAAGASAARFPSWREQVARFAAVLERFG
ncbi:MAG: glycosyltransferase family 4 protein [Xanthobacteraceae bacterium]